MLAYLAIPISLFLVFFSNTRRTALLGLVFSVSCLVAVKFGGDAGYKIRRAAFENLAARSEPLLEAVKQYTATNGIPPAALTNLVPDFFASIPATGMDAYPDYEYAVAKSNEWDGNPWVIYVHTPSGGINFDRFLYFPRQNYPETGYGGRLERIGDWAYVHE